MHLLPFLISKRLQIKLLITRVLVIINLGFIARLGGYIFFHLGIRREIISEMLIAGTRWRKQII